MILRHREVLSHRSSHHGIDGDHRAVLHTSGYHRHSLFPLWRSSISGVPNTHITFLHTFWHENDRVEFQLLNQHFGMSLDEFSDVLDVPRGGVREPSRLIYKMWVRITRRIHTRERKSNYICHVLLRYIHRALFNSVFA